MTHCKKCNGKVFPDISTLRKHQWAEHRETFDNLRAAKTKAIAATRQAPLVRLGRPPKQRRPPLLASELLSQLQSQQKFLNDVVSLISGILAQHEGRQ